MPFTFPTSTNKLQGNSNDTMLQYRLREFALCQIGGEKKNTSSVTVNPNTRYG